MLRKKLYRTILEKKSQFLAAWLLIVISSIVFYSFTAAGANLIDNLNYFYKTNHVEDAQFAVQKPLTDLDQLENKTHATIEPRYTADVPYSNDSTLRLLDATKKIDLYSVVKGHALKKNNDILIDQSFAKAHHLSSGDKVDLNGKTFNVSGYMAVPDYIYPIKSVSGLLKNPQAFGVAVVQQKVLKNWNDHHIYYSVKFSKGAEDQLKKQINQNNHLLKWINKKDNNRISFVKGDIAGIKQMGEFLPVGILGISIVIILILLWRLMKKEYVQIGTLYALGYKKGEIIRHYLSYAGILAISGSIIGTILGWFLLHPLLSAFAAFYNLPVLIVKLHLPYLLISLLLPLVIFLPLTYYLVQRVLKIPPVVLIKGGELKTKVNVFERLFKLKRMSFNRKFVIRDIMRNLPRALFLTIGVMFATLLLLFGFVTKNSMQYLVTDSFKNVYHYKYDYLLNSPQTTPPPSGQIGSAAPAVYKKGKEKESITLYGLKPNNSAIQLKDSSGKRLMFNSVIINKSLADKIGIKSGETMKVTNQLTNKTYKLTIDRIADSYLGDMIYMPLNKFNELNGFPSGSYTEIFSQKSLDIPKDKLLSATKASDTMAGFKQIVKPLNYGIAAIALVAGIIAVIIMYILISLMIEENAFKISLMKVLGYSERSIKKLMIGYNIWFVILGFVIGIPVTLFSISSLMNSITAEMNMTIPVKADWFSILISFVILIAAYYVSIWLNHRKLKSIKMTEAINRSTE